MVTYSGARSEVEEQIQKAGWQVSPDAMDPLRRIDFTQLVDIIDHEERFLKETFLKLLFETLAERAASPRDQGMVSAADVRKAIVELGKVAKGQPKETLSDDAKEKIRDGCGFC